MTTLQSLLMLLGFAAVQIAVHVDSPFLKRLFIRFLKAAMVLKIVFFLLLMLALPFHKNEWSAALLHLKIRYIADLICAGSFTGYLASLLLFPGRTKSFKAVLLDDIDAFCRLVRFSAGCTFLFSAISAIFFFDQSLAFFTSCGYSRDFMIFIISLEMICSMMLLSRRTAGYAALLLTVDMIGAVFTHYHNFFEKNFTNPFGNSVPALITLTLLVTVICLNAYQKRKGLAG